MLETSQFVISAVIASGMLFIAYQQWKTARAKLISDMFLARLECYEKFVLACQTGRMGNQIDIDKAFDEIEDIHYTVGFLFGNDMREEVRLAYLAITDLHGYGHYLSEDVHKLSYNELKEIEKKAEASRLTLFEIVCRIEDVAAPYLSMNKLRY